jgi:hypothetical protein
MLPNAPTKAVRITSANFQHSNGCTPSAQQLRKGKRAAGSYTREIKTQHVKLIIGLLVRGTKPFCKLLRSIMGELYPPGYAIHARDLANMRFRCKRIISTRGSDADQLFGDLDRAQIDFLLPATTALVDGRAVELPLDQLPPEFISEATRSASDILKVF